MTRPGLAGGRAPELSRRRLLAGGAALAGGALAGGALSGCSSDASAAETLDFWHLLTGSDGAIVIDVVDDINNQDLNFQAEQTVLAWGSPYYTKLAMASVGSRPPDLAVMHASRLAGYAPGGLLDPWDLDLLAEHGLDASVFPERVWNKGHFDGQLYALPIDVHPFIMYYNTDVAERAGLLGPDGQIAPITSPEQLLEAGTRMAEVTGRHGISFGYLDDGAQLWRFFYGLYRQHGAELVLEPGKEAQIDMDAAINSLDLMRNVVNGEIGARAAEYENALAEFTSQDSGILFGGVWDTPALVTAEIPFDATPVPNLFGTPAAYADSHTFVLPHQDDPGPNREHAYRFVAEFLNRTLVWGRDAGHIPAYQPITESPEYQELVPQSHYADAAEIVNYDPEVWFAGAGADLGTYFLGNVQNVLLGSVEPRAGLEGFVERLNTMLDKPNPV